MTMRAVRMVNDILSRTRRDMNRHHQSVPDSCILIVLVAARDIHPAFAFPTHGNAEIVAAVGSRLSSV